MQSHDNIVRVIHHAKNPVNFRPHTHHRLLTKVDDLFLLRYTSYQHYLELLQQWKIDIFDYFLTKPLQDLQSFINEIKHDIYSLNTVFQFQYLSDLSDPDRDFILQRLFIKLLDRLGEDEEVILLSPPLLQYSSNMTIEKLLITIAEGMLQNSKIKQLLSKKLSSAYYQRLKESDPMEFIQQLLGLYSSSLTAYNPNKSKVTVLISFPFYEIFHHQNLIHLLTSLFQQHSSQQKNNWHTIFFISQHRSNPTTTYASSSSSSSFATSSYWMTSSLYPITICHGKQVYEKIVLEIFVKGKLPFHLPYDVMNDLHQEFNQFTNCNSTFLQRLQMIIYSHFETRRSILCMIHEWKWLVSMHLVRGLSYFLTKQSGNLKDHSLTEDLNSESSHLIKSDHSEDNTKQQLVEEKEEDYALKALSELLHSLKPDDLPRRSVFQFSRPKLTQLEKEEEMRKMKQEFNLFWEVRLFMKVMFQFFKSCRDGLLLPNERESYSTAILWKEMINVTDSKKPSPFFIQFDYLLSQKLQQLPLQTIGRFLNIDLSAFLSFQVIWKQFQLPDFQEFNQDFLDNIQFLKETYELIEFDIFEQCSSLPSYSLEKLKQIYQQQKRSSSSSKPNTSIYSKQMSEAEFLVVEEIVGEEIKEMGDVTGLEEPDEEEPFSSPSKRQRVMVDLTNTALREESQNKPPDKGKPSNSEKETKKMRISHYDILEEFVQNLQKWVSSCIQLYFSLISLSPHWNGLLIFDYDSSSYSLLPLATDDDDDNNPDNNKEEEASLSANLLTTRQEFSFLSEDIQRQQYIQSILQDSQINRHNGKLVEYYLRRIQTAQSTETAMNWYLSYQDHVLRLQQSQPENELSKASNDARKKKRKSDEKTDKGEAKSKDEKESEEERLRRFSELPAEARCTLVNTLYDFERTGILTLKKTDNKHITIQKSIFTGINS